MTQPTEFGNGNSTKLGKKTLHAMTIVSDKIVLYSKSSLKYSETTGVGLPLLAQMRSYRLDFSKVLSVSKIVLLTNPMG